MITVRDYALKKGVTERAVYKQMKSKKNAERLQGHVQIIDGKQWLDPDAIAILDESRTTAPVVEKANNQKYIDDLNKEIELLNKELRGVYNELAAIQKEQIANSKLIAEAETTKQLLADKSKDYQEEKDRADQLYRENIELKVKLEAEQSKTWLDKLFRR